MSIAKRIFVVFLLLSSLALAHDTPATRPIAPGVIYTSLRRTDGPWEIRVLRINRAEQLVHLSVALGQGRIKGVERLSGIIAREARDDDYAIAGANADFFVMGGHAHAGTLCGLTARRGELIMTARGRPAFILMNDGKARIGVFNTTGKLVTPQGTVSLNSINHDPWENDACVCTSACGWTETRGCVLAQADDLPLRPNGQWRGFVMEVIPEGTSCKPGPRQLLIRGDGEAAAVVGKMRAGDPIEVRLTTPGLEGGVALAVGGGPELLRDGGIVPSDNPRAPRHPRTAIGHNGNEIVLVTVDGRQRGWSVGMRLHTLAKLMQELGCTDALNLDGGGSTTAWVRGEVVNRPSDGAERRIANALLIRSRAPRGPLARLTVSPTSIVAMPGARVPLQVWPTDEWCNPVECDLSRVMAGVKPSGRGGGHVAATYTNGGLVIVGSPGEATVRLGHPDSLTAFANIPVRLVARCARVELTPPVSCLCVGETVRLTARGLAEDGARVWLPERGARWEVEGEGIEAAEEGVFRATSPGAVAEVTARVGEATGVAEVKVAREIEFEGFEAKSGVRFAKYPDTEAVSGSVEIVGNGAGQGARYCRMNYDLGKPSGTRAAYIRLDREIGTALKLSLLARGTGSAPAWLRVAVVDGNGSRHTLTVAAKVDWGDEWRRVAVRLPDGLKPPLTWRSVYVVATAGRTSKGSIEVDDLRVARVEERAKESRD